MKHEVWGKKTLEMSSESMLRMNRRRLISFIEHWITEGVSRGDTIKFVKSKFGNKIPYGLSIKKINKIVDDDLKIKEKSND